MRVSNLRRDKGDGASPAVTLVRVEAGPVGEDREEGEGVKVVKVSFLNKDKLRYESEGADVGNNAVMAGSTSVSVMISRYTIGVITGDARVGDGGIVMVDRGRGRRWW